MPVRVGRWCTQRPTECSAGTQIMLGAVCLWLLTATAHAQPVLNSDDTYKERRARRTSGPSTAGTAQWLDTTEGIHAFLSFDYHMTPEDIAANGSRFDFVRGASGSTVAQFKAAHPGIALSAYIPFTRDMHSKNLSWWQLHHPTWIVYQCDRKTPTFEFGDVNVPLDIGNEAVIEYQLNYTAQMKQQGYDTISFDNFGTNNNFHACGTFAENGTWLQKWKGTSKDQQYTDTVFWWLRRFSAGVHNQGLKLMPNFMLGSLKHDDKLVLEIGNLTDGIVSEGGFTDNSARLLLGDRWEEIIYFMQNLQSQGKAYWSINEWGCAGSCGGGHTTATLAQEIAGTYNISRRVREWVLASYLIGKGNCSGVYMVCNQCYGIDAYFDEYKAPLGHPLAPGRKNQTTGMWERDYSNGKVLLWPIAAQGSLRVDLGGKAYTDLYGHPITEPSIEMLNGSAKILLT